MNQLKLSHISIVMFGLGLACLTARPCRAQAEINPDHYDEAPLSSSTVRPATTTQPVATLHSGAAPQAKPCGQVQSAENGKRTVCNARVQQSGTQVAARSATSAAKPKDKSVRQVAALRTSS